MENVLFYAIKEYKKESLNAIDFIVNHSHNKYGEHLNLSVFAYTTLLNAIKKVYKVCTHDLDLQFLDSGKPVISGFSVSVAHSHSAVAVAFFRGDMPVGIDIELILNKKSERLNKLLNLESNASKQEQYLAFTKRESVIKAFDLKMLSSVNNNFKGVSKTIKINNEEYALSVYFDGEIKEIEL